MTATIFFDPRARPLSLSGQMMPLCYLTFYETLTETFAPIYADAALGASLTNPLVADADGRFPVIYMDAAINYRVQLHDADDVLRADTDPYLPPRDYPPGNVQLHFGTAEQRDAAFPPTLWQLLDGSNGTPDGRGKGITIAGGAINVGGVGGSATATTSASGAHDHGASVSATTAPLPSHNHSLPFTYTGIGSARGGGTTGIVLVTGTDGDSTTGDTGTGGTHTHSITGADDHTHTVATVSPYVALWAVMRKYP